MLQPLPRPVSQVLPALRRNCADTVCTIRLPHAGAVDSTLGSDRLPNCQVSGSTFEDYVHETGGTDVNAGTGPIPNWNPRGVLPPVPGGTAAPQNRSPYSVSLIDFVLRFSDTKPRREIVSGFLEFRGALQTIGLVKGFSGSTAVSLKTSRRSKDALR